MLSCHIKLPNEFQWACTYFRAAASLISYL